MQGVFPDAITIGAAGTAGRGPIAAQTRANGRSTVSYVRTAC